MSKTYDNPELEVVKYEAEDVLNNSQTQSNPNKPIVLPPDLDDEG